MGRPQGAVAAPPSRFAGRAVVVRHAPPPPLVSFAARRDALQANPGRPLDPAAAEALRRTQPVRAPQYRLPPAPPRARVSFAARRDPLQANPGRPLDPAAAEALRRTQPVRAPQYRQAPD